MNRLRRWWAARTLRTRITVVVGVVALAALLTLSRLGGLFLTDALVGAADSELRGRADAIAGRIVAGEPAAAVSGPDTRIVDTAGDPVDGGPPLPLRAAQVRELAAGEAQVVGGYRELRRWLAVAVVAPDGSTRLVVVSGDLIGGATLLARAAVGLVLGALLLAGVVTVAAWAATRAALRPVDRMRLSAAALPPGQRLPVPPPADELRALAEEFNALLARRDDAVARLERFTGDAAHELRSPVTAIRAQAEVAVAHPDPELTEETLRAIVAEATRLSVLLSDLLALARADAGQRRPAESVDLVAAAGAALLRAAHPDDGDPDGGPALELVAPAPVTVAATASEVATVLDNLLGNARRHADSLVRVAVLPAGRAAVRLVVEDDGPGIPEADRGRIFDRFLRLAPEAGGGAGLGLPLVAALVAGRGGSVAVGTRDGGGARFEVRWPTPAAASPSDSTSDSASDSASGARDGAEDGSRPAG